MKHWKLLLAVPLAAAIAMVPQGQDPESASSEDLTHVLTISELQYVTRQGEKVSVSARNVVEIRLIEDITDSIRLELYYENQDYSLIDAQSFHLLRSGASTREVRVVRGKLAGMRFPKGLH